MRLPMVRRADGLKRVDCCVGSETMGVSWNVSTPKVCSTKACVLLSIGFWLYILGEMYFGAMPEAIRKGSRAVRLGYFWIRLILTIGWAIYPILHFVDVVIGAGQAPGVVALYTLFDLINLITPSLIVLAVAGQERY